MEPADIEHGPVHGLLLVGEDPQSQGLVHQPVDLFRPIAGEDAHERQQTRADLCDHRGFDRDGGTGHALQQDPHNGDDPDR